MKYIDIDNKKFKKLFNKTKSIVELALKIGFHKNYNGKRMSGVYYKLIKRKCIECNLDYSKIVKRRDYKKYDDSLKDIVPKSKSIADVLRQLKLPINHGSIYQKIKNRIKLLNIRTSHFTGAGWSKGLNRLTDDRIKRQAQSLETPWKKAFSKNSIITNESLMKRLIFNGKLKYKCYNCGMNKWNQKPLRLILDHIDGDNCNCKEKNLRLLCPNCNSQTDTFCRGTKNKNHKIKWWEAIGERYRG